MNAAASATEEKKRWNHFIQKKKRSIKLRIL